MKFISNKKRGFKRNTPSSKPSSKSVDPDLDKTNIDKKVALIAMASTNVSDYEQDESSSTEQLIPIPYQSFYSDKTLRYYGSLSSWWS